MPKTMTPSDRLLALALFAVGFAVTFHGWLWTGFDAVVGDEEDGYLALALIEHWRHVFAGEVRWSDPIVFYPQRGTLGYSDGFFLIGLAGTPLRLLGFDIFTSAMIVVAALAAAGFFGLLRVATRHFAVAPPAAAVGAYLFAFANMDAVKLIHVQSYCAMLLPCIADLALSAWQAKRHGAMLGAGAGLVYAALFLTAYQTAWFFGCCVLLLAVLYPVVFGVAAAREAVRAAVTGKRHVVLAAASGFAAGMVPFLALYVPIVQAGYGRDFAEVAANMPDWRDLANVTPHNALWGEGLTRLGIAGRPDRPVWEVELGFTPAVLALFAAGLVMLAARLRRKAKAGDRLLLMMGLAVVVTWLLQMDYLGARPWWLVWAAVPGAGAIRYTFRSQLVANLMVSLVIARTLAALSRPRLACLALSGLVLVEQVNLAWPATMSRRAGLAWIEAVPPPPVGCMVFYVAPNAAPPGRTGPQHQDDAMLYAEIAGIPTVNGYSSWFPKGWSLEDPASPGYPAALRDWARQRGIDRGLCGLDPRAGIWSAQQP